LGGHYGSIVVQGKDGAIRDPVYRPGLHDVLLIDFTHGVHTAGSYWGLGVKVDAVLMEAFTLGILPE